MALYSVPFLRNSMVTHLIKITKSTITTTISRSVQKRMAFSITRINAFTLNKERIKKRNITIEDQIYIHFLNIRIVLTMIKKKKLKTKNHIR